MAFELFHQEHRLASCMEFVLTHLGTFLEQMVLDVLNLDDLITFPTGGEHWALLPVVDVQRLVGEAGVVSAAEIADFIIDGFLWLGLLLMLFLLLLLLHCSHWLLFVSNISFNGLYWCLLLWLLRWHCATVVIDLRKPCQECIQ
jgi:hypothetical protein